MTSASQETWTLNLNLMLQGRTVSRVTDDPAVQLLSAAKADTNVTSEGNMPHFLQTACEIGGMKWKRGAIWEIGMQWNKSNNNLNAKKKCKLGGSY